MPPKTPEVTRLEVIDRSKGIEEGGGRVYTNYKINDCWVDVQDGGKTIKVFINETPEVRSENEQFLYDNTPRYTPKQMYQIVLKTRTAEQERVVGIVEGMRTLNCQACENGWHNGYNEAIDDFTEAIRNKELTD